MSIGLKSDSSGTSGSIVINGSDAVLVTPTGITTASIQNSSITTAKIADANITYGKLSTSATEADNVAKRTAKVWVNYNGLTNQIIDDFNVSTVTDGGNGTFTINFSSNLSDANYCAVYGARGNSVQSSVGMDNHNSVVHSTSQLAFYGLTLAGTATDFPANYVVIFGS
jgi:hypothetical protein